ncbi:MAG: hypothetical protein HZB55_10575 [Deltaproteobacteria bacterium]|nr:hypothetical protein [Deltaproteobacteria bacterium]
MAEAVRELEKVRQQARAMGLFAEERELLECPKCGLWEDVTCDGLLITYPKDDEGMADSGLRFREVNEDTFRCPACGSEFRPPLDQGLTGEFARSTALPKGSG